MRCLSSRVMAARAVAFNVVAKRLSRLTPRVLAMGTARHSSISRVVPPVSRQEREERQRRIAGYAIILGGKCLSPVEKEYDGHRVVDEALKAARRGGGVRCWLYAPALPRLIAAVDVQKEPIAHRA